MWENGKSVNAGESASTYGGGCFYSAGGVALQFAWSTKAVKFFRGNIGHDQAQADGSRACGCKTQKRGLVYVEICEAH